MNKVALITGGAKRVGRAIALTLAESGMDIVFTWNKSQKDAVDLVKKIQSMGRQVSSIRVENTDPDAIETLVEKFNKKFNRLDALINNASCFEPSLMGEITRENFDRNMAINARFPLLLTQAFSTKLAKNYQPEDPSSTGRIVNFVDTHVLGEPLRDYISYNASKAALLEITNTCALELAPAYRQCDSTGCCCLGFFLYRRKEKGILTTGTIGKSRYDRRSGISRKISGA